MYNIFINKNKNEIIDDKNYLQYVYQRICIRTHKEFSKQNINNNIMSNSKK